MIDAHVVISLDMEAVVASEGVRVNDAVGHDAFLDDGHQCLRFGILNHLCVDLPSALQDAKYRNLPCSSSATFSFTPATEVTLIHFYFTGERPLPLLMSGNGFSASSKEENGGMTVHVGNFCGCSCCCSCNEQFQKFIRLTLGELAPFETHGWQCRRRNLLGQPQIII